MAKYTFTIHIEAPPELVFDLWTDLDRMKEWVRGMTAVEERTGPIDQVGSSYTVRFGRVRSRTTVIDVERPRRFATRFGNWYLRGQNVTALEAEGSGTRLTETFETEGVIPAIMARIWASGSYEGSFRGELEHFGRLAEEAARAARG
jgi:uncharacterized protein YndB with AHSA1/START domain